MAYAKSADPLRLVLKEQSNQGLSAVYTCKAKVRSKKFGIKCLKFWVIYYTSDKALPFIFSLQYLNLVSDWGTTDDFIILSIRTCLRLLFVTSFVELRPVQLLMLSSHLLTLSTLGKIFSRPHVEIFF